MADVIEVLAAEALTLTATIGREEVIGVVNPFWAWAGGAEASRHYQSSVPERGNPQASEVPVVLNRVLTTFLQMVVCINHE